MKQKYQQKKNTMECFLWMKYIYEYKSPTFTDEKSLNKFIQKLGILQKSWIINSRITTRE